MYFNYHAKLRKLLTDGQLIGAEITDERKGISPVMILYFMNGVIMPVREHKFDEYIRLIAQLYPDLVVRDMRLPR